MTFNSNNFQIDRLRSKDETAAQLRSIFTHTSTIGSKTRAKQLRTASGVKDTYQDHFSEMIAKFVKGLRGSVREKQARVDRLVESLPDNLINPVWRIQGKSQLPWISVTSGVMTETRLSQISTLIVTPLSRSSMLYSSASSSICGAMQWRVSNLTKKPYCRLACPPSMSQVSASLPWRERRLFNTRALSLVEIFAPSLR